MEIGAIWCKLMCYLPQPLHLLLAREVHRLHHLLHQGQLVLLRRQVENFLPNLPHLVEVQLLSSRVDCFKLDRHLTPKAQINRPPFENFSHFFLLQTFEKFSHFFQVLKTFSDFFPLFEIFSHFFPTSNSPPLVQTPVLLAKNIAELGECSLWGDVAAGDYLLDYPTAQLILIFLNLSEKDHPNVDEGLSCLIDAAHLKGNDLKCDFVENLNCFGKQSCLF